MQELTLNLPEGIDDGSFMGRTAVRGIICQNEKYLVVCGQLGDCKFPGGGMEQGEFLFGTLTREVLEETGCHVKPDSIREGFLVHEKTKRQAEEVLVMDSYYYFCEVEDNRDSKEAADASGYAVENFYEGEAGTKVCWLPLADMIARNENVKEPVLITVGYGKIGGWLSAVCLFSTLSQNVLNQPLFAHPHILSNSNKERHI